MLSQVFLFKLQVASPQEGVKLNLHNQYIFRKHLLHVIQHVLLNNFQFFQKEMFSSAREIAYIHERTNSYIREKAQFNQLSNWLYFSFA